MITDNNGTTFRGQHSSKEDATILTNGDIAADGGIGCDGCRPGDLRALAPVLDQHDGNSPLF
jgi:hypothetical protein